MKYYCCVLVFAVGSPQAWGADAARVLYHVETVAGSSLIGDGGPALSAQFSNIQGIALDRLGNLYLSDADHHRVRKVSGGTVTTIAGTGVAGFTGDGKAAVNAQLNFPYGLAADSAGNVYVADLGNQRVRRIGTDGVIATIAGTGKKVSSPDGAAPLDTSLLSPRNVAVDAAGNLYIAEFEGHRVRKLTPGGKLTTVAGTGVAGWSGDGNRATAAQINYPAGMAFDRAGALYFADSGNHMVRKLYADGTIGSLGTAFGGNPGLGMSTPVAIAVDQAGTLYVGGPAAFVVRAFTATGKWITYTGIGDSVNDMAADPNGNLFIADGPHLRRLDPLGTFVTVAGDGYLHSVGDGEPATMAELYLPSALALDSAGNLFIADSGTERVRQVTRDGTITTLAGTGTAAEGAADGSPAGSVALNTPMGVAMDSTGNVLVADTYNHRILLVTLARAIRVVAGTGTSGASPEGTWPLLAQLRAPRAVCADYTGNLYVVDTSNHRVLRLAPGGTLQTAAGNGSEGNAGDGGAARFAQLDTPSACAIDSAGNLFIADTANHTIRKVNAAGIISTVAGTGVAGTSWEEAVATEANLYAPRGLAVDDMGDIFIADTGNHRIRQVTPDGRIHTIAGTGVAGFSGDGDPAAGELLNGPQGLFLDGAGDLYFADTGNNRIRRLVPDLVAPDPVIQLPAITTVVNAISLRQGAVAPGEIAAIFGTGLGPDTAVTGVLNADGVLPGTLGGVEVRFEGALAPIFYAQSGQLNVQVPYTVAATETASVEVRYQEKVVGTASVPIAPSAPAMLTLATNPDGSPNAESAPAPRSTWMTFYATGEGLTDGPNIAGTPAHAPYPHPLLAISLTIAGLDAEILYAGSAPDLIGVMQINARVPGGFVPPGQAAVALTMGTATAPPITVWLK
jgi:uncharacterized protein (TIGR03437 family)